MGLSGEITSASESHPTGVRGLKLRHMSVLSLSLPVAPHWGAWIEMRIGRSTNRIGRGSHPTGVRGLKYRLRGFDARLRVAPHWGAWIEIDCRVLRYGVVYRRTPLGCVD